MEPNWDELKSTCCEINKCSDWAVTYAHNRGMTKEAKKAERNRRHVEEVFKAVQKVWEEDEPKNSAELYSFVLAALLPWVLPFLREMLLGAFRQMILNWLIGKLKEPSNDA